MMLILKSLALRAFAKTSEIDSIFFNHCFAIVHDKMWSPTAGADHIVMV
jgi:hypothetical protein